MTSYFPGAHLIRSPLINLRYDIRIDGSASDVWPWIQQIGYHRGGWYIDTWWDKFEQTYLWPNLVPEDARGVYKPPADNILAEYQDIRPGDIIPDGPPGSAYYEVVEVEPKKFLLLFATTHFKYVAPQWVYRTRFAPRGAFCWAFILNEDTPGRTTLTSWWQAEGYPRGYFTVLKPMLLIVDAMHQRAILKGVKARVELAAEKRTRGRVAPN